MLQNYHMHSLFSDGKAPMEDMMRAAFAAGVTHAAATDHHDLELPQFRIDDPAAYVAAVERCRELLPGMHIARGLEVDYRPETWEQMQEQLPLFYLDFILLSLHFIEGLDAGMPAFFEGCTQAQGYRLYLERLTQMLRAVDGPFVVGHITYASKFIAFEDTMLRYRDFPDELDEVLRLAAHKGFGIEINSSGLRNNAGLLPGADIVARYKELGGEILTLGSDCHLTAHVDFGLREAHQAALQAGFRYVAVYEKLKPTFLPIE